MSQGTFCPQCRKPCTGQDKVPNYALRDMLGQPTPEEMKSREVKVAEIFAEMTAKASAAAAARTTSTPPPERKVEMIHYLRMPRENKPPRKPKPDQSFQTPLPRIPVDGNGTPIVPGTFSPKSVNGHSNATFQDRDTIRMVSPDGVPMIFRRAETRDMKKQAWKELGFRCDPFCEADYFACAGIATKTKPEAAVHNAACKKARLGSNPNPLQGVMSESTMPERVVPSFSKQLAEAIALSKQTFAEETASRNANSPVPSPIALQSSTNGVVDVSETEDYDSQATIPADDSYQPSSSSSSGASSSNGKATSASSSSTSFTSAWAHYNNGPVFPRGSNAN